MYHMKNEIDCLKSEVERYIEKFDSHSDNDELESWKSIFISTTSKCLATLKSETDWQSKINSLVDIHYFFAPRMGSFVESCPDELFDAATSLISTCNDCLRYCWKAKGNKTYSIPKSEILPIGQKVNLIQGELMVLGFAGYQEVADFVELHTYEVIQFTGNDISGMPTYNIKNKNTIRNARHNSLIKTDT